MKAPILIQLELLLDEDGNVRAGCLPRLAELNRAGQPLVLVAPRPDTWRPTLSTMDTALDRQGRVYAAINQAGGAVDGVLYLDFGLFTRKARRTETFNNLAGRYHRAVDELVLIAPEGRLADAFSAAGGRVLGAEGPQALERRLREIVNFQEA